MVPREEFQDLYDQGPDAVYDYLLSELARRDERVQELEAQRGKDSHNSSKPPSSDGLKRGSPKPHSLRESGQRPNGGQPGHPGRTLSQVEQPNEVIWYRPQVCEVCGCELSDAPMAEEPERRQVFDVPRPGLVVTEYRVCSCACPVCQSPNRGSFPTDISQPAQWGRRMLGLGIYLMAHHLVPVGRTQEALRDLYGQAPSQATLLQAVADSYVNLAEVEQATKQALGSAGVVHFDETGVRVEGRLDWIHVASTADLTYLAHHRRRGRVALNDIALLPNFTGVSVHDAYGSYREFGDGRHALCNAHVLRELVGCWERDRQGWAHRLMALLRLVLHAKKLALAADQTAFEPDLLARIVVCYRRIVARGLAQNPRPAPSGRSGQPKRGPARSLLERLERYEVEHLRFAFDFQVPFDNNQAERDFRMVKVQQKTSGCFRTSAGADQFCRIRGYLSTLRKQGINLLDALCATVAGSPIWPSLVPT